MATPDELLTANLHDVFNERDRERRLAAIKRNYAEDVTLIDPEGTHTGWAEVEHAAESLLADAPADFVFAEDGLKYFGGGTAALGWTFGSPGKPVARGLDILTLRNGLVASIHTVLHTE